MKDIASRWPVVVSPDRPLMHKSEEAILIHKNHFQSFYGMIFYYSEKNKRMDSVKSLLMIVGWGIGYFFWNAPLVIQPLVVILLIWLLYKWVRNEHVHLSDK